MKQNAKMSARALIVLCVRNVQATVSLARISRVLHRMGGRSDVFETFTYLLNEFASQYDFYHEKG